jgi:DNA-binding transcriptional ArsR family regulator
MSPEGTLTRPGVAPVFAALGDETRLQLLARLATGEAQSIVDLTRGTGLTRQGVSKHLAVLEKAGVVSSRRSGRESRYSIEPDSLADARAYLERASRQWDEAIARLRIFVADRPD